MGILGLFSLLSCAVLFVHISYRGFTSPESKKQETPVGLGAEDAKTFDKWTLGANRQQQQQQQQQHEEQQNTSDMTKVFSQNPQSRDSKAAARPGYNSFLTLIHHLLVADMFQAMSFVLSLHWWRYDGIFVPSTACAAQGFFINLGSLSSSALLVAMSFNTLLTSVWGYKLTWRAVWFITASSWVFAFGVSFVNLGVARSFSARKEWYYARSKSLCWVNWKYASKYGIWLQNFWITLSIGVTIICYLWIFVSWVCHKRLIRRGRWLRSESEPRGLSSSGLHSAFLVYPVIFIICAGPILLVGLVAAGGTEITNTYLSFVSILSSVTGLLDAILWSTTILFSSNQELEEVGLGKYNFVRTPERDYGNIVWVEGATRRGQSRDGNIEGPCGQRWWKLNGGEGGSSGSNRGDNNRHREEGIHLDTITTVTVDYVRPGARAWPKMLSNLKERKKSIFCCEAQPGISRLYQNDFSIFNPMVRSITATKHKRGRTVEEVTTDSSNLQPAGKDWRRVKERLDSDSRYKLVFIIRHGAAEHNQRQDAWDRRLYDRYSSKNWDAANKDLSTQGKVQAQDAAIRLMQHTGGLTPQSFYTGPHLRCITQTTIMAKILSGRAHPHVAIMDEMREWMGFGHDEVTDCRGTKSQISHRVRDRGAIAIFGGDDFPEQDEMFEERVRSGESVEELWIDVDRRWLRALEFIWQVDDHNVICICSNNRSLQSLLRLVGFPCSVETLEDEFGILNLQNSAIIPLLIKRTPTEEGLEDWNDACTYWEDIEKPIIIAQRERDYAEELKCSCNAPMAPFTRLGSCNTCITRQSHVRKAPQGVTKDMGSGQKNEAFGP
ncbi:hypothetical protein M406DRAFT_328175 [Cryphonectria parasitica EP155]|uniref:G-protein coupled receptors family 1 profile domain-containing protein n=1 Tax=Cryphonectria parasitica (strain ATCC 38755 / EP155) TaxID=660469 RepID=A0A9P4Y5G1_CRYP1|nr:uncharacterized protein M406DRAFT_328175 [Cryphonectria parasitica EP155]KAF3767068.1 hypothetical protein M406DRAFT_328175 [Cryphonectria parasitica EP155]